MKPYHEKLQDKRWQEKRLEIIKLNKQRFKENAIMVFKRYVPYDKSEPI
jgi:hypothetical protein